MVAWREGVPRRSCRVSMSAIEEEEEQEEVPVGWVGVVVEVGVREGWEVGRVSQRIVQAQ